MTLCRQLLRVRLHQRVDCQLDAYHVVQNPVERAMSAWRMYSKQQRAPQTLSAFMLGALEQQALHDRCLFASNDVHMVRVATAWSTLHRLFDPGDAVIGMAMHCIFYGIFLLRCICALPPNCIGAMSPCKGC